ncbi:MAG: hypothetical protein K9M82_03215 [Deltaproteobacteria bacterium]|nr:hypothetical protein [Deltaproteobacteria bacterium]
MTRHAGRWNARALGWLLWILVLVPVCPKEAEGYVIPPEQLLEFMAENVAGYDTLGLSWEHRSGALEAGEEPAIVNLWYRSPEDVRVEIRNGRYDPNPGAPGAGLLELFCGNRHRIERFLARHGLDLQTSAYTRLDGTVAYRIGRNGPAAPVLLLEKSRFIPLLFRYEPDDGRVGETTEILFREYSRAGDGWFPHEILYRAASGVTGVYKVLDLKKNEPLPAGFSSSARPATGEEERLERVIRAFEEKYGD